MCNKKNFFFSSNNLDKLFFVFYNRFLNGLKGLLERRICNMEPFKFEGSVGFLSMRERRFKKNKFKNFCNEGYWCFGAYVQMGGNNDSKSEMAKTIPGRLPDFS